MMMMMIGSTFMENRDHLFTRPTADDDEAGGWVEGRERVDLMCCT